MKYLVQFLIPLIAGIAAMPCHAQEDRSYEISTPVDLDAVGVNKVLCMKNGNTLLFHFEPGKPVKIKVFDSTHKRVASAQPEYKILDGLMLRTFTFKGVYDIGGEAVLFVEQQNSGRHSLVRWRINSQTGKMIEEETIGKSRSMARPARFYVMKNKDEDDYAILVCNDVPQFKECEMHVTYYNRKHEAYREISLPFDRKKYDYLDVVGAEALPNGICVSIGLSTLLMNGTGDRVQTVSVGRTRQFDELSEGVGSTLENASVYNHHLGIFLIPKDSSKPLSHFVDVKQDIYPYYTHCTYNAFAKTVNLLMLSYRDAIYRYGLEMRPMSLTANLFFKLDEDDLSTSYSWIENKLANEKRILKDTGHYYNGLPIKLTTNSNGLSTIVSESFNRYHNSESKSRADVFETFLGDICVTQLDDDGKELWGTILPKSQYHKSYRHYYSAWELGKRWQHQEMFGDLPPQVYNRQFLSCNTYNVGSNIYVIYNDYKGNMNSTTAAKDTVFTFDQSNTCYYKINKNKEITKEYLYGTPLTREYKTCFIEGADFDERRGVYASLIQYRRGDYVSLRMAWKKLD